MIARLPMPAGAMRVRAFADTRGMFVLARRQYSLGRTRFGPHHGPSVLGRDPERPIGRGNQTRTLRVTSRFRKMFMSTFYGKVVL